MIKKTDFKDKKARIYIEIDYKEKSWFDNSLNEVFKKLKEWYAQWLDSNEDENYTFEIIIFDN